VYEKVRGLEVIYMVIGGTNSCIRPWTNATLNMYKIFTPVAEEELGEPRASSSR